MRVFLVIVLSFAVLALAGVYAMQGIELRIVRIQRDQVRAGGRPLPAALILAQAAGAAQGVRARAMPGRAPARPHYGGVSPAVRATSNRPRESEQQTALIQDVRSMGKRLADDPVFRRVAHAAAERQVDKDYATLFQTLDPEEATALAELLKLKADLGIDASLQFNAGGLTREERWKLWDETRLAQASVEKQIQDLLGADGYAQYQDYVSTLAERQQVSIFKEKLFSAGLELSPSQEELLVQAMYRARHTPLTEEENPDVYWLSTHLPEERKLKPEQMELRRLEAIYDRYLKGAESFLTPDQLAVLEEYLNQDHDVWDAQADYMPSPDVVSNDRADASVGNEGTAGTSMRLTTGEQDIVPQQWGDQQGGSSSTIYRTKGNMLGVMMEPGSGWGSGLTFWPAQAAANGEPVANAAGATKMVVRIKAPAGVTLRLGLLESGVNWPQAQSFQGESGADGEAYRHPGFVTQEGWQTYTIPLSELKLNGGYGNQTGNRRIDTQGVKGLEILMPGGQSSVDMEVEFVGLE